MTVLARLMRARAILVRGLEAELISQHGLTINDFDTLLHLSGEEDSKMRRIDLAARLSLTPSGVTRLLDGLMATGLVDKASCSVDARVSYAVLTDAGRAVLVAAVETNERTCRALIEEHLDTAELEQLSALLGRLPSVGEIDGTACEAGGPASIDAC